MSCRIVELRNKEVINIKTGCKLGCVNDIEVDMKCAKLIAIIIYGKPKCFGLFGREEDILIRWDEIEVVGDDTILVCHNICCQNKKRRYNNIFRNFFK